MATDVAGAYAYHIVLVPRNRHKTFSGARLQKRCAELLHEISEHNALTIHETLITSDHVHLGIGPTCSVSDAITVLKYNSARVLFSEFPEPKKKFWSGQDRKSVV